MCARSIINVNKRFCLTVQITLYNLALLRLIDYGLVVKCVGRHFNTLMAHYQLKSGKRIKVSAVGAAVADGADGQDVGAPDLLQREANPAFQQNYII